MQNSPRLRPTFESFLQGGFECSTHKLKSGKRLDLVHATSHDRFVVQDYQRLTRFGIRTVREGLRWHLIESRPQFLDFDSAQSVVEAAENNRIEVIWDLLHFGWPDWLDIFKPEWVDAFARLASGFAEFLKSRGVRAPLIAPVNEISFLSWAGGDVAYLNPFAKDRGTELKRQLVRGAIASILAFRKVLPDARIVSPEPVIHIVGNPDRPGDVEQAEAYRVSMFEAWDMLCGRSHSELGGREEFLDIVGVNYYDRNQWWNYGETIRRGDPMYRPFREILKEVFTRYERPLFVSETGSENEDRAEWLAYVFEEVRAAGHLGVPVEGICLYPILNHPGWDDDRHCYNGLWDYAGADGERSIYEPLAEELCSEKKIILNSKEDHSWAINT